jgi:hypothetical protein
MQDDESRPTSNVTQVNSSNWRRTLIAVVITALIAGTSGYLLRAGITQSPPNISIRNPAVTGNTLRPSKEPSAIPFVPGTFYTVPPTNPVVTANWKTYKSAKYSFTFHYPPHMYASTLPYPSTMYAESSDDMVFATKPISLDYFRNKNEQELQSLQKGVSGGTLVVYFRGKDFPEFNHEDLATLKSTWIDYKDEGIVIGGRKGRIISGSTDWSNKIRHIREIYIPLKQEKHLQTTYIEETISLDEFNQILSTFKFIN